MAAPSAGLAVMPEKPSEPPHSRPIFRCAALTGWRRMSLAPGSIASTAAMPAAMVARVPPVSCITKVLTWLPNVRPCEATRSATWLRSQPRPTISTPPRLGWRA